MLNANDAIVQLFLESWHEAGREVFEAQYTNLDYDSDAYRKTANQRRKYICLDDGRSGAFILDRRTGDVWCCKGYGVPNKNKHVGRIEQLTGYDALRYR
ncbi:MAG: hypothetical protein ABIG61_12010 [Planctomycetota bacterium]